MRRRNDPRQRMEAVKVTESVAELARALEDPSPEVARGAVARLVEVNRRRAAPVLRERLLSSDPALVGDVARALRALGDPTVVGVAIGGLREEPYSRRLAAARALEALADPRGQDALLETLRDPIAGVRTRALAALAALGQNERAAVEASALLSDADAQVRIAAVRAILRTGRRPGALLAAAARDRDRRVRLELGRRSSALPADAARALLTDPDLRVREAAARGAGRGQVATLARMLVEDPSSDVRCAAAQSMRELADPAAADLMLPGLEDADAVVRAAALRALRTVLGTDGTVMRLREELRSPSADQRRAIVYALGHLNATDVGRDVARLVEDPEPDVRLAIIHTARALHRDPASLISHLTSDLDPGVRHSAQIWLERQA